MTTTEKQRALVQRLAEKTERGEMLWEESIDEHKFLMALNDYAIEIHAISEAEFCLRIRNANGAVLLELTRPDLYLQSIYTNARSQARHADEAVDAILRELNGGEAAHG